MKRTIIQQGTSYTVTLPKKWVEDQGLKNKDEVSLTVQDKALLINVQNAQARLRKKTKQITISSETEPQIRNTLNILYRLGYDCLEISFMNEQQSQIIAHLLERRFLGFEITEKHQKHLIIENIAEPNPEKIDTLIQRLFFIVQETFAIFCGKKQFEEEAIQRLLENTHKYNNYLRRAIIQQTFPQELSHFYWDLFSRLTLIEYSLWHLFEEVLKKRQLPEKKLLFQLAKHYETIRSSFFKKEKAAIEQEQQDLRTLLFTTIFKAMPKAKRPEILYFHFCGELARLLYLLSVPLLAILTTQQDPEPGAVTE